MKRAEVITVVNQKGGIGKTTTAQNIASGLSILKGYNVLMVDLDAQCNLTIATGAKRGVRSSYNVLCGDDINGAIQPVKERLDIIPASQQLSRADLELSETGKEYKLKEALEPVITNYDYIVIDCPPALGVLTINALTVANRVVIPAQADLFSLEAIKQLSGTIDVVNKYTNNALMVAGILLTRHNPRNILTKELTELIEETAKELNTVVFAKPIREAITIKEATASRTDIFSYRPNSKVAGDYKALVEELLKNGKQ